MFHTGEISDFCRTDTSSSFCNSSSFLSSLARITFFHELLAISAPPDVGSCAAFLYFLVLLDDKRFPSFQVDHAHLACLTNHNDTSSGLSPQVPDV